MAEGGRAAERSGCRSGRGRAGFLAVFEAIALAVELQDVDVVGNLTLADAGVPMSATTRQKYAAEMAKLGGDQAQLRKTLAAFRVQIGRKTAQ